ncbi:MAG: 30S ribosomal protein S20 [Candidatus Dasytiphilus stammeri]
MAKIKSAQKRIQSSELRRKINNSKRSMLRTFIKKVYTTVRSGDKKAASIAFSIMQSALDRQSKKGLIHKNKAARHKSNLIKQLKNMN